jgi:hypothetical protein
MKMSTELKWRKASASQGMNSCVEVAISTASGSSYATNCVGVGLCDCNGGTVHVRDTKDNGTGPELQFTIQEWEAFLDGAGKGEFTPSRLAQ